MQLARDPEHKREWVHFPWKTWNESLAMSIGGREMGKRNTRKSQTRPTTDSHCLLQEEKLLNSLTLVKKRREKRTHLSIWVNQVTNCFVYIEIPRYEPVLD